IAQHRATDRHARDEHEDHDRTDLLAGRQVRLRDLGRTARGQDQVLRVDRREDDTRAERLHGRERVDGRHPLRHLDLGARRGPVAEVADAARNQQDPEDEFDPRHRVVRAGIAADVGTVAHDQHDHGDRGDADDPSEEERGAVHLRPRREEDQDHRDDGNRTDRDPDRECQNLADDIRHDWNTPVTLDVRPVGLAGGQFRMGTAGPWAYPGDGEAPVHDVTLSAYTIDATAVTNAEFAAFVAATGHVTDAERYEWSFVFAGLLPDDFEETR